MLDRCRELYNACLQERKEAWNAVKRHPNYYDPEWRSQAAKEFSITHNMQSLAFTEIKRDLRPEYQEIGDHVSRDVIKRVDLAYQAFFRRVRQGKTPGFPRFRGRSRYDSFCYPDYRGWKIQGKRLLLAKIGDIKVKLHRALEGSTKSCTIRREGEHWYVCFVCEVKQADTTSFTDDSIGIDLGLLHFATLSTGDTIENPRYYRKAEKRLERAQKALSRKKRGSTRRKKAVQRVAKCHRKVRNQRQDFLHKQSRQLVNTYELIVFEKLTASHLSKRPKPKQDEETGQYLPNGASAKAGLNKSILDAGWSTFVTMCEFKAVWAGLVQVIKVDPKNTSQICSGCGKKGPHKDLSERTHTCEHCGVVLDRDHNAAINILRLGEKQREATLLASQA